MADLTNKFGVKFEDGDESKQVDKIFGDSYEAAAYARSLFASNPTLRDVRVVTATELANVDNFADAVVAQPQPEPTAEPTE